jgi:26S proteasome regulatory subunit N11
LYVCVFVSLSEQSIVYGVCRQVAVVVDPIQSVKGKVVIDAFRMIPGTGNPLMMMSNQSEPRQTTSNVGYLKKPTIQARIHGLDRQYYSLVIDWRKNDLEEQMLMNLHKKNWIVGLQIQNFEEQKKFSEDMMDKLTRLSKDYCKRTDEEEGKTAEELEVLNVGKLDPKKHLENDVHELMANSILQCLGSMIDTVVF